MNRLFLKKAFKGSLKIELLRNCLLVGQINFGSVVPMVKAKKNYSTLTDRGYNGQLPNLLRFRK